ncbi:uncharacterized membrane protein At3g27390 isoform X1 [Rhodamnia argentea]|uniref:Uncharacterized membrane protein At3g27390 isoform X1 n=1 Tax=Rhodamnia argentea TaxID=178133 RepID=A0A8B8PWZ3_9MYRT|nr:uncharacterized membrane protein At3g27390 isoform X1 [Rhodamnia argentea]
MTMSPSLECWLKILYVVFAFFSAFFLGALKAVVVGPFACLIVMLGNAGVILGLFPAHVTWTVHALIKINGLDGPLKVAILLGLPALFGIWLVLSLVGTALVGVGYGFFAPWVLSFEAFSHEDESMKFLRCIKDGTWDTIKGSCTLVQDFMDMCCHSYPTYLKELHESTATHEVQTFRLVHIAGCILVGLMGLIVDVPLYTAIMVIKSPYMLFKGWFRLIHDLISREGPFLETACIPITGLTILTWPIAVASSILAAAFSSCFIGLYGAVIVYQERSFRRGVAYVIAMAAEFDEYTNDCLYLQEGTILPKPSYRKQKASQSSELSVGGNHTDGGKTASASEEAPAMLVPSLVQSRSVRETIQEIRMVQLWGKMIKSHKTTGKALLDANIITPADLFEWLKAKTSSEATIIGIGLPCYSLLQTVLHSIKAGSDGFLMRDGFELNQLNRPKDKVLDWFFGPVLVLKEQIKVMRLEESEVRFLEKVVLFGSNKARMDRWKNGGVEPQDPLRAAQIRGISRRMIGIIRSESKLPTYRRKYHQVVKALVTYSAEKEGSSSDTSVGSGVRLEDALV